MEVRVKQKIDYFAGYALIGLLLPFTRLLGITMRRDHSIQEAPRRILFIKLLGLGSLIVASDAVAAIRSRYPNTRLILLTDANIAAGIAPFRLFDEIHIVNTNHLFSTARDVLRFLFRSWQWRRLWVIDLEVYSKLTTVFALLTLARNRFGFYLSPVPFRKYLNTHNVVFNQDTFLEDNYERMAGGVVGAEGQGASGGGESGAVPGASGGGGSGVVRAAEAGDGVVGTGAVGRFGGDGMVGGDGGGGAAGNGVVGAGAVGGFAGGGVVRAAEAGDGVVGMGAVGGFRGNGVVGGFGGDGAAGDGVVGAGAPNGFAGDVVVRGAGATRAGHLDKPYIFINNTCSSLANERKLPERTVADICRWVLENTAYGLAILGMPSDKVGIDELIEHTPELKSRQQRILNYAGQAGDFPGYYHFLQEKGVCLVTIDSGPLHIARKLGLPTVSVWGPTDPGNYLKLSPEEKNRHLSYYWKTPCSPCVHRFHPLPCGGNNFCMKNIPSSAIILKICELLENLG